MDSYEGQVIKKINNRFPDAVLCMETLLRNGVIGNCETSVKSLFELYMRKGLYKAVLFCFMR